MLKLIIPSLFILVLATSCVTTGKYNELMALKESVEFSRDSLKKVVSDRDLSISDLKQKLESLKKELEEKKQNIEKLENSIANQINTIQTLKANSTEEMNKMLSQLEKLQNDLSVREKRIKDIESKLKAREDAINALKDKLSSALLGFKDAGLTVSIKNGKVYVSLSNQLLFKSGSTSIDKNGQEAIRNLANVLNNQTDINVLIEGHTDIVKVSNQARFKDNWDLSVLRATEVTRFLTDECSVDPKRIIASGRGEYFPVIDEDTPEAHAANRRTEIILTPKLNELYDILNK